MTFPKDPSCPPQNAEGEIPKTSLEKLMVDPGLSIGG